jgi:release factor glutamine methyltransferase
MNIREVNAWLIRELMDHEGEREARSLARIVLEDGFGVRDVNSADNLHPDTQLQLNEILQRLKVGEPVQYLVGKAHFHGYTFQVDPAVLVPRPETEELVELILKKEKKKQSLRVLDVGTGSGCIAITLKKKRPKWDLWALDISADALLLAEGNAVLLEAPVEFRRLDVGDTSEWGDLPTFDLIVSNPPYVEPGETELMADRVTAYEPDVALFTPPDDPLFFYHKLAELGVEKLVKGGRIYFEGSEFHLRQVLHLLKDFGYSKLELFDDMQGKNRMVTGLLF